MASGVLIMKRRSAIKNRPVSKKKSARTVSGERNIRKLKKVIQADKKLQARLGRLRTGDEIYELLSKVGAEEGLTFTKRDFRRLVANPAKKTAELTPEEITSMAGGFHIYPPKTAYVQFGNTLIQTLRWFDIPLER
jgi:hypothetical protein